MQKPKWKEKKVIAPLLFGLALVISGLWQLRQLSGELNQIGHDPAAQYMETLGTLRPFIPPFSTVGYMTDQKLDLTAVQEYYLTESVVCPAIVKQGMDASLILANLKKPAQVSTFFPPDRYTLLARAGENLFLFQRRK